jgi:hypothetical protein
MSTKLSVVFPRKSPGRTIPRALASLGGAAGEALPMLTSSANMEVMERECRVLGVPDVDALFGRRTIVATPMLDVSYTYGNFLPEKNRKGALLCYGNQISSDLSLVANELLQIARGDYVLFMAPGEVCLDPENLSHTLRFLDEQPHLEVVVCPVKVYENGEHVRTVNEPKIFRKRPAEANRGSEEARKDPVRASVSSSELPRFVGVLADDFAPRTDGNWLLSASGLTFQDHNDAWADPATRDLTDLKMLLASYVHQAWPESDDQVGREKATAAGTRISQLLARWNSGGALVIADGVIQKAIGDRAEGFRSEPSPIASRLLPWAVPAMVAKARTFWRTCDTEDIDYFAGLEILDEAIAIGPTAAAFLERGFLKHGMDDGWHSDLMEGVRLARDLGSYGLDLRELHFAQRVLMAKALPDRCKESTRFDLHGGDSGQCIFSGRINHTQHESIINGLRVTWCDP